ncbi:DUF5984 family protein [Actinospica robiniae]|uniref:DUF5984 family protein n=1 Tax=Actinospica robiniae TaxID=304901 RepID=UPI0012FCE957|nr:DUF5984 family protein [Actinospica robiniae]
MVSTNSTSTAAPPRSDQDPADRARAICDTCPMIRFRFDLRLLQEVEPWGRDEPALHWFALVAAAAGAAGGHRLGGRAGGGARVARGRGRVKRQ